MFASAAEYYRRHPYGDTSHDENDDADNDRTREATMEDEYASEALPRPTTLRLSGAMLLEDALDRIREAMNEKPVTTTHRLMCMNLGLDGLVFDEEELPKTLLARLLHSRDWEFIELHSCRRTGVLLDVLSLGSTKVHTLSLTGGQRLSWIDLKSLAKAIPQVELHTLHLFMTLPKPPAPFPVEQLLVQQGNEIENEVSNGKNNDDDDDADDNDDVRDKLVLKLQDPSSAMKVLITGLQLSVKSLEISLSRRDVDTFGGSLSALNKVSAAASDPTTPFGRLQRLDLRHAFLADHNIAQIVHSIVPLLARGGQLQALDLRGHCECQTETLQALSQPSPVSLKQLWISSAALTEDPIDGLHQLLAALLEEQQEDDGLRIPTLISSLQALDLGNYMITDRDMETLLDGLTAPCSTLKKLNLLSCGMTSAGLALWEQALPRMDTLQHLLIPADASHSLKQGLIYNTSLESLELERDGTNAANRGSHYIWLNLNRGGRRLFSVDAPVPAGLWPLVLERAEHGDVADRYYGGCEQSFSVRWYLLRNGVLLEQ